jgi:pimeloyl-ACP methyl ester carboxylesterase
MTRRRTLAWVLAGVAVAMAGFVYTSYRSDIDAQFARVSQGSEIASTPCGRIEYTTVGRGVPLLVVHGAGGGFDQGVELASELANEGVRIIAMSRFGYLRTPLPADASAAAQADAHACLLDALAVPRAAVIGASAGAPSAMQLALRHPGRVTSLILLVPAVYAPRAGQAPSVTSPAATQWLFETALKSDFLFWAAIRLAPDLITRAILATPLDVVHGADAAERQRVATIGEHILPVSVRRLGLVNDAAVVSSLPRYELERIGAPTLAISMSDDLDGTADAARYSAEHIPGARLVIYPTGGHVGVGHRDDMIRSIAAFVRAH